MLINLYHSILISSFVSKVSALHSQEEAVFWSRNQCLVLEHWLVSLINRELKLPEDVSKDHLLLIESKLLSNAVPGRRRKRRSRRGERRRRKRRRRRGGGKGGGRGGGGGGGGGGGD